MSQRLTQNADFWETQFQVSDQAVEGLYNELLETGEPRSTQEVCLFFIKYAIEEEEERLRSETQHSKVYRPNEDYELQDQILFPHFDFAIGTVVGKRSGYNAKEGDFSVIEVVFEEENNLKAEFAVDLSTSHALLETEQSSADGDKTSAPQKIFNQHQSIIRPKVEQVLQEQAEFVSFNNAWFLKDMLVDIQEGLLNIVDAAIDINSAPLNVDTLIEQIELQGNSEITEVLRFSVNYKLNQDDRFENVGHDQEILWYLQRLKPERVKRPPRRLKPIDLTFNANLLDGEQLALLSEIDDEATPQEFTKPFDPKASSTTFVVNYHHRRLGTLPVLPAVRSLLPPVDAGRIITLQLVDGRTGDEMLCWYVNDNNYILGLDGWYNKYKLPVGVVLTLTKTDNLSRLVIDFTPQRTHQEHIKVAIAKNNQLGFELRKRRLSCKYDELMIIGEEGSDSIDKLWDQVEKEDRSIYDLLIHILPELTRFYPQGTVHIKSIYSAVNVLKRCSPGLLMQELMLNDEFVSMGHGYWAFKK